MEEVKTEEKIQSGYKNCAEDPILAKQAYEFVMDLHGTLKRKRKPFENVWVECQEAFRGVEKKTYFQGTMPYCSSDLRDAVLQIVPKFAKAIWYTDTPFDLIPIGEEGDDDKLAEINQKVLEWDFRNLKIYLKYVDSLFQKAIFGTTIVKTPPHWEMITKNLRKWQELKLGGQTSQPGVKELKRVKELDRMFMGTDFVVTDLLDFWIDPVTYPQGMKDAVEYGDCIESICIKKTALEQGKKSGIYTNLEKIENYHIGAKKSNSNDESNKNRMKGIGHVKTDSTGTPSNSSSQSKGNKSYEIKETYAEFDLGRGVESCLIVIGADKECIRLQPWECEKPYLSSRFTPNGYNKEFYGTGLIETNLSNHYERNATRKQVIMARTMGLNMEMLSDQTGFVNKPDKLRTAANKVHWVKNINGVKPFEKPIGPILQSARIHEENLKEESRQGTGNTLSVSGQPTPQNGTAAGINMLQSAGNERFTLPLQVDESGLFEPYVKRCLQNNVDYRKESFVIRLTDKKPIRVEPEKLSANFDVFAKGSSELQNKQIRQGGLLTFFDISLKGAEMEMMLYGQPLTKFAELKKEIAANLGISQPETVVIDPKELQQQAPVLTPDIEWILLKRMAEGVAPVMPIMIQPGEDYKAHYEDHKAKTASEEFQALPPQIQQIWYAHLMSYQKVLQFIESQKREVMKEEEIKTKEVAISQ